MREMIVIRFLTRAAAFLLAIMKICMIANVQAEDEFSVQRIGQMVSNRDNIFSVHAPENGVFSVAIRDDYYTYRMIDETVSAGINEIRWDGCGYNSEKLDTQYYTFDFSLVGESGKTYSYFFRSPVVRNDQFLQFVLPSGDEAGLGSMSEWFVEIKAVCDGIVSFEFSLSDGSLPISVQKPVHGGRVEHYTLEKLTEKKPITAGQYSVTVYEISKPERTVTFPLHIVNGMPACEPVRTTGEIMPPEEADDSEIWERMMQPSVVIDAEFNKSIPVYEEPDKKAVILGTLHGATQCLSVFELRDGWARIGAWNHESADYMNGWIPDSKLKVVYPNKDYGLLVNKKEQTLTVFYKGRRIETLLISTGHMDPGKLIRETAAGMYLTGLHRVPFSMQGSKYDYVIQYDGGNLLHQIPYSSAGKKDFTWGKAYLGSKASHACIRIQDTPGPESGINAYWIWTHIPFRTKIIILDDPEEREKAKSILCSAEPVKTDRITFLEDIQAERDNEHVVLTFGGNVVAGNTEGTFYAKDSICTLIEQEGISYPLSELKSIFESDDWTCLNLESTLKSDNLNADRYRSVRYRGLPEYAGIFSSSSVEMVSFGDHVFDYRTEGFNSTVQAVETKAEWIGYGKNAIVQIKNHTFGFGACTEEEYLNDPERIKKEIEYLRSCGCEFVIYQCNWGNERDDNHSKLQEAMARACERAGSDLLIGYHPEKVQGIDYINEMPVFYGLGNLISPNAARSKTYDSLIVQAVFDLKGKNGKPKIRLIPVLANSDAVQKTNDCHPIPAQNEEERRIIEKIQKDTGFKLNTDQ